MQLDDVKKTLYKEIQQAWYNALASESKYTSSSTATNASAESFKLMSEKYDNGKATAVEYNEAKQNLMNCRLNMNICSVQRYWTSIKEYRLNNFFSVFLLKILLRL